MPVSKKLAEIRLKREMEESWRRGVARSRRGGTISAVFKRLENETVYRNLLRFAWVEREEFDSYYQAALWLTVQHGEDEFFAFTRDLICYLLWLHAIEVGYENVRHTTSKEMEIIEEERIDNITKRSKHVQDHPRGRGGQWI